MQQNLNFKIEVSFTKYTQIEKKLSKNKDITFWPLEGVLQIISLKWP